MKLAVVGKGGSGKTTISRLLTHYIATQKHVLAIDSDHNMDLIDLLGYEFSEQTPTFKNLYQDLFYYLEGEESAQKASQTIKQNLGFHKFSLDPRDDFSQKVIIEHDQNIDLAVVGLGGDDIMGGGMCAHGISNPLKIYLTLMDEGETDVVVDAVAGVDMINFGLYHACDFLVIVVEPSRNGVKVAKQIQKLCDMSDVNYGFVINKYQENDYVHQIYQTAGDKVITTILYDDGIFHYRYDGVSDKTITQIQHIYDYVCNHKGYSLVERMVKLEEMRGRM